jgi:D-tyrosyl-tRNA(Tyr) deacylase
MRAVLQRVTEASVTVDGDVIGAIGPGLLILLGIGPDDGHAEIAWMVQKVAGLRLFPDDEGKMNRSVVDVGGAALVVSQFTLYGDCRKGRRPSFTGAAPPERAAPLVDAFGDALAAAGVPVARGRFAADMQVRLLNDGPVTLIIDSPAAA